MATNTLIDAGPIIALFTTNDRHHEAVTEYLKAYRGTLTTNWPVITEASHMLSYDVRAQLALLKWIERGALQIQEISGEAIGRIAQLMEKYSDLPMDLADATLVLVAETSGIREIMTIDSHFNSYRTVDRKSIRNVLRG